MEHESISVVPSAKRGRMSGEEEDDDDPTPNDAQPSKNSLTGNPATTSSTSNSTTQMHLNNNAERRGDEEENEAEEDDDDDDEENAKIVTGSSTTTATTKEEEPRKRGRPKKGTGKKELGEGADISTVNWLAALIGGDLPKVKLPLLKGYCKAYNLLQRGNKPELIMRIATHIIIVEEMKREMREEAAKSPEGGGQPQQ